MVTHPDSDDVLERIRQAVADGRGLQLSHLEVLDVLRLIPPRLMRARARHPYCGSHHPEEPQVHCQLPAGHFGDHQWASATSNRGERWPQVRL